MGRISRYISIVFVAVIAATLLAGSAAARSPSALRASAISYPPIGAALDTAVPVKGGGYEIEIGGNCLVNQRGCRARTFPYGNLPVQLIVLDRATLSKVTAVGLSGGPAGASTAAAEAHQYAGGDYLMILADEPGHTTSSGYSRALKLITGAPNTSQINLLGWAAAGVPTSPTASGVVTGTLNPGFGADGLHPAGDLRGYFESGPNSGPYSFVSGRYASYNTHAPGSSSTVDVMQVGQASYTMKLPDASQCTGGYAMLILNAANLVPISQVAYATNCPSGGEDSLGWSAVNAELALAAKFPRGLLFIQSIGNPANPGCLCSSFGWSSGTSIESLGASAETWNRSLTAGGYLNQHGASGYAMAGSPAIAGDALSGTGDEDYAPEAVSTITGQAAQLQGLLRGDSDSNYLPVTGAAVPTPLGATVATAEYGASSSWPTGGTPGQLKVLSWISGGAKGSRLNFTALRYSPSSSCYRPTVPDVRFEFCDTSRGYNDVRAVIERSTPPAACGCTQGDWHAVTKDLSLEISRRNKVMRYLSKLNTVYGSGNGCANAEIELQSITAQLRKHVLVSNNSLITGGKLDSVLSDGLNVASSIFYTAFPDGSVLANILNNLSAAGYLAGDGVGAFESANSLAAAVKVSAGQLGPALQKAYCTTQFGIGEAEATIFTDYGKLRVAASSSAFQISQRTLDAIGPELKLGAERFIYGHLLGSIYQPYALLQSNLDTFNYHIFVRTTRTFACNILSSAFYPWSKIPANDSIQLSPHDPPYPSTSNQAIGIALSTPFKWNFIHAAVYVKTPSASVMATITKPIAQGGLGESLFDLFFHNFKRSAVLCLNGSQSHGPNKTYGPSTLAWP